MTVDSLTPAPVIVPFAADRVISILGVELTDVTRRRAIDLLEEMVRRHDGRTRSVFFVNAHTLNLANAEPWYRKMLGTADYVFGDGTGVRWAARVQGVRVRDNLVGTDLVPELFRTTAGRKYRYFLLGADEFTVSRAAAYAAENFPGWTAAGFHHGYLADPKTNHWAIDRINQARPDLLLVGMGNPIQEQWIYANRDRLEVPLAMGIGGLFDYWAGNVSRAPGWLRRCGHEWVWRLFQQPRDKASRYLLGNPLFLWRIVREKLAARHSRLPSV